MKKDINGNNRPSIDEIRGLAAHVGATIRQEGREMKFTLCPFCGGGSHKDKNTFSVNVDSGAYICHRASCEAKGSFVELAKAFDYPVTFEKKTNGYISHKRQPQQRSSNPQRFIPQGQNSLTPENPNDRLSLIWDENKAIPLSDAILKYFASRGISMQTQNNHRVETGDTPEKIKWNFFEPSGKRVELIKIRDITFAPETHKQKEVCMKNCRQILYGMELCSPEYGPLIITEGQIDALSLSEAGIPNAVSVPIGKTGNKWVGNCYEFVGEFKEIIIFGDCERNQDGTLYVTLVNQLVNRVDVPIRIVQVKDYLGCKDANEMLVKYGKDVLWGACLNARRMAICNSRNIADIDDVDLEKLPHFETGIAELDRRIRGFYPGQLVLLTGKTGEGKSTFASQILCDIVEQGGKCLVYSGELDGIQVKNWLYMQLAGNSSDNFECVRDKWGEDRYSVKFDVKRKINDWIDGKLFVFENSFLNTNESESQKIIKCCLEHIHKLGVTYILIDNLMTAVSTTPGDNLYDAQTSFVRELASIAKRYGVVIMLVAHPRKTKESLTLDDISGASNISNFADVILGFGRTDDGEKALANCGVNILKSRLVSIPRRGEIKLHYHKESKRISGVTYNDIPLPPKKYGWEKSDQSNSDGFTPVPMELEDLPF